jgi:hypothetical protein
MSPVGWLSPWAIKDTNLNKWIWKADDPLVPAWTFPNVSAYMLYNLNSANPPIHFVDHFNKILAAAADYIRDDQDLSVTTPFSFTIDHQPDVPRNLTWTFNSHAQITTFSITITGINAKGTTITDTITQDSGWSGETVNAYAYITSIRMTNRNGSGAGDTMDVGIGSKLGLANDIASSDKVYKVVKSSAAGNSADYTLGVDMNQIRDTVDVSIGAAIVDGDSFTIYYQTYMGDLS